MTKDTEKLDAASVTPNRWLTQRMTPAFWRFAGGLSWTLAGHLLVRISVMLAGLGISRALGVDAFADFTFYLFSIALLAAFSDMGISYAMMKYGVLSRMRGGKRTLALDRLAASLQLGFAGFVLSFAAILLFTRVGGWAAWQILALGLAGLAAVWQACFAMVLMATRQLRIVFLGNALFASILLTGVGISASVSSPLPAMLAYPAGALAQCAYQARVVNRDFGLGWSAWLRPRFNEMPAIFGLIGFMMPTSLVVSALPWAIANIQLSRGTDKSALAVFGVGILFFGLTMVVPGRIGQLFFIEQVEQYYTAESARQFLVADTKAAAAGMITALFMSGGLILAGDLLLNYYGPQIAIHAMAIYTLASVSILACPYQIVGNRMVSTGWQALWLPVTLVQAAVLLALVWHAPMGAHWSPPLAYWASYTAALAVAMPLYLLAVKRPRA